MSPEPTYTLTADHARAIIDAMAAAADKLKHEYDRGPPEGSPADESWAEGERLWDVLDELAGLGWRGEA